MSKRIFLILIFFSIKFMVVLLLREFSDLVKPSHYNIKLLTQLNESKFIGVVDILIICIEGTDVIKIHAMNMKIARDRIAVSEMESSRKVMIMRTELNRSSEQFIMRLEENLLRDSRYIIHIEYEVNLENRPVGFYNNFYYDQNGTIHLNVNTQFEPTWARFAFPCFDSPHMKATFEVTIGHHEKYVAINNMPLVTSEPVAGRKGWVWDQFEKSPPMSTYLVAFAVLDAEMKQASSGKITWWYPPLSKLNVGAALNKSVEMLSHIEEIFGMKYELSKLDFLVVDNFPRYAAGGESWGLIMVDESTTDRDDIPRVIAKGLIHQWIGNLISINCFGEVWIKEVLTKYYLDIAMDEFNHAESTETNIADYFIDILCRYSQAPLSPNQCYDGKDIILDVYSRDTYEKGSLLTRMIQMCFDLRNLNFTIQTLMNEFNYNNFDENDIWTIIGTSTSTIQFPKQLDIREVFESWTKQIGIPIVEVRRDMRTGTATLTQNKIHFDFGESEKENDNCWWIPITYMTKSDLNSRNEVPKIWMPCPRGSVVIKNIKISDWFLINLQSIGMFIVKYDSDNWNQLYETLIDKDNFQVIPVWNRFRLILDSNLLSHLGLFPYETLLNTLLYMKHETDKLVWKAAFDFFSKLDWLSEDILSLKRAYMKLLITPHFSRKLFDYHNISIQEKKFRNRLISEACESGIEGCTEESFRLFEIFQDTYPRMIWDEELLQLILCIAVRYGTEEYSQFLMNMALKVQTNLKDHIVISLFCQEPDFNDKMRNQMVKNGSARFKYFERLFEINAEMYLILVLEHSLKESHEAMFFVDSVLRLSPRLHSMKILTHLESVFANPIFNSYRKRIVEIFNRIRSNIEWKNNFSEDIRSSLVNILRQNNVHPSPLRLTQKISMRGSKSRRKVMRHLQVSSKSSGFPEVIQISTTLCIIILVCKF